MNLRMPSFKSLNSCVIPFLAIIALSNLAGCAAVPTCTDTDGCVYWVVSQYDQRGYLDNEFSTDGFVFHRVDDNFDLRVVPEIILDSQNLVWLIDKRRFIGPGEEEPIRVKIYSEGGSDFSGLRPPAEKYESVPPPGAIDDFFAANQEGVNELRWNRDGRGVLNSMFLCLQIIFRYSCTIVDPLSGFDRTFAENGWISFRTGGVEGSLRSASHWKFNDLFIASDLGEDDVWDGDARSTGKEILLLKYTRRGAPHSSFGSSGRVTLPLPIRTAGHLGRTRLDAKEVDVDSQNRVLVMYGENHSINALKTDQIVRLMPSGALDTSFADTGVLDLTSRAIDFPAKVMMLQADNKILVSRGHYLSRFNEDGSLDTSFGFFGTMPMPFQADGNPSPIRSIQLDAQSRIYVLAGRGQYSQIYRFTSTAGRDPIYPAGGHLSYRTAAGSTRGQILAFTVDTNHQTNPKVYVLAKEFTDP